MSQGPGPNIGGGQSSRSALPLHLADSSQRLPTVTAPQEFTWQVSGSAYSPVCTKTRKRRHLSRKERQEAAVTRKFGACTKCKESHKKCVHNLNRVPIEPSQYEDFLVDPSSGYESEHNRKGALRRKLAAFDKTIDASSKKASASRGGNGFAGKVVVIRPKPDPEAQSHQDEAPTSTDEPPSRKGAPVERAQSQHDQKSLIVAQKPQKKKAKQGPLEGQNTPFRVNEPPAVISKPRQRRSQERKSDSHYMDESNKSEHFKDPDRMGSSNTVIIPNATSARVPKFKAEAQRTLQDTTNLPPRYQKQSSKGLIPAQSQFKVAPTSLYGDPTSGSEYENIPSWHEKSMDRAPDDALPQIAEELSRSYSRHPLEVPTEASIESVPQFVGYVNPADLCLRPAEERSMQGLPYVYQNQYCSSADMAGEESMTKLLEMCGGTDFLNGDYFLNEYEETLMNDESTTMGGDNTLVEEDTERQAFGLESQRLAEKAAMFPPNPNDQIMADLSPMITTFPPAWTM